MPGRWSNKNWRVSGKTEHKLRLFSDQWDDSFNEPKKKDYFQSFRHQNFLFFIVILNKMCSKQCSPSIHWTVHPKFQRKRFTSCVQNYFWEESSGPFALMLVFTSRSDVSGLRLGCAVQVNTQSSSWFVFQSDMCLCLSAHLLVHIFLLSVRA